LNLGPGSDGTAEVGVLLRDRVSAPGLRSSKKLRVFSRPTADSLAGVGHLFVLCAATDLPSVAKLATDANREHRLRGLFVRQDVDAGFLGPLLGRAGLRLWRNVLVHHGPPVPLRVLRAWEAGAQDSLIAEAALSGDRLFVLSCALDRLEVPVRQVAPLARLARRDLARFVVAPDGSYIHWPRPDIHLDLEALHYAIDPAARVQADLRRAAHDRRFGAAVAAVRADHGLSQAGIPGVSERQVRRIEHGSMPRVATLRLLARAHGLSLETYLGKVADRARVLG
jgi:hypothetical protein